MSVPLASHEVVTRRTRAWLSLILLLALGLRLDQVMMPVSGWHAWRQADTAAIARNYYESGHSILYPQVDWRGDTPGYVESEFHVYPYLVSLLYRVLGPHDAVGRLVALGFSLLSIFATYRFGTVLWGRFAGLCSGFALAVFPLHAMLGRAFMPESAMLAFSALGVWTFYRWCRSSRWRDFVAAWLCITLAILVKIPTLYLGLPMVVVVLSTRSLRGFLDPRLWLLSMLILAPPIAWYYHASTLREATGLTFGIWGAGSDKWANWDLLMERDFYARVFLHRPVLAFTWLGTVLVVLGALVPRRTKREWTVDAWLVAVLLYVLLVAQGNYVHDYYQAPALLPGALLVGRLAARANEWRRRAFLRPWATGAAITVALVLYFGGASRLRELHARESLDSPLERTSRAMQFLTEPGDLVISVNEGNPVTLYRARRKGWNAKVSDASVHGLEKRKEKGARYVFGAKDLIVASGEAERVAAVLSRYELVHQDAEFFLARLDPPPVAGAATYAEGWRAPEVWGRWADRPRCSLTLDVGPGARELVLTAAPWQESTPLHVEVTVNDRPRATITIEGPRWLWRDYRVPLAPEDAGPSVPVELRIRVGDGEHGRVPGFLPVKSVICLPTDLPQVQFASKFGRGWKGPESWGRWGIARSVDLRLDVPPGPATLVVRAATWPAMDGSQPCVVRLEGQETGRFEISGPSWEMRDYRIALREHRSCSRCTVQLEFEHLWPGSVDDPQPRSIALEEIRVERTRAGG